MGVNRPGDLIAGRFRLADLLNETEQEGPRGRFWRADDMVLGRPVSIDIVDADDERSIRLASAARASAAVGDPRLLRVLDASHSSEDATGDDFVFVVNEWGEGTSLDNLLIADGPLEPRRAAWIVSEVADCLARAHAMGHTHGRVVPENVLLDRLGAVRIIGFAVEAALYGLPATTPEQETADLAALLHAALTATWPGRLESRVPSTPLEHGQPLRPRQIRAGVPSVLDDLCHQLLSPTAEHGDYSGLDAAGIHLVLTEFVGDPADLLVLEDGSTPAITPRRTTGTPHLSQADIPTQFDLPVFEDGDDVVRVAPVLAPEPVTQNNRTISGDLLRLPEEEVPGRRWQRLALGIGLVVLLFVALVLGFNHFNGGTNTAGPSSPRATSSASAGAPITGLRADDYDPPSQGGDGSEHPESAPLAVDGKVATAWETSTYDQNVGPGGIKSGVGLVVDLGGTYDLSEVRVLLNGAGTKVQISVSATAPGASPPPPLATYTLDAASGSYAFDFDPGKATGRYVTLWLTSLGQESDGWRSEIAEVTATGRKVG